MKIRIGKWILEIRKRTERQPSLTYAFIPGEPPFSDSCGINDPDGVQRVRNLIIDKVSKQIKV